MRAINFLSVLILIVLSFTVLSEERHYYRERNCEESNPGNIPPGTCRVFNGHNSTHIRNDGFVQLSHNGQIYTYMIYPIDPDFTIQNENLLGGNINHRGRTTIRLNSDVTLTIGPDGSFNWQGLEFNERTGELKPLSNKSVVVNFGSGDGAHQEVFNTPTIHGRDSSNQPISCNGIQNNDLLNFYVSDDPIRHRCPMGGGTRLDEAVSDANFLNWRQNYNYQRPLLDRRLEIARTSPELNLQPEQYAPVHQEGLRQRLARARQELRDVNQEIQALESENPRYFGYLQEYKAEERRCEELRRGETFSLRDFSSISSESELRRTIHDTPISDSHGWRPRTSVGKFLYASNAEQAGELFNQGNCSNLDVSNLDFAVLDTTNEQPSEATLAAQLQECNRLAATPAPVSEIMAAMAAATGSSEFRNHWARVASEEELDPADRFSEANATDNGYMNSVSLSTSRDPASLDHQTFQATIAKTEDGTSLVPAVNPSAVGLESLLPTEAERTDEEGGLAAQTERLLGSHPDYEDKRPQLERSVVRSNCILLRMLRAPQLPAECNWPAAQIPRDE